MEHGPYLVRPIGFVRSPFSEKALAPRQATVAAETTAEIVVLPEYADALDDLAGFDRVWILFWFDRAAPEPRDERARGPNKVLPPRSEKKRGVFATRSPHRPNPIGMSAVVLERIDGVILHVRGVDLLDGTPVLDLKPYLPYSDAFPEARAGWLERPSDPRGSWTVCFDPLAEEQLAWLAEGRLDYDLRQRIHDALVLGPQPHAYRRIKTAEDGGLVLSIKEWRARFTVVEREIHVHRITTGYRPRELAKEGDLALVLHRAFVGRFG